MFNLRKDREALLFFLLVLIHLIPLWSFTYFPSQDGPAHLENAVILREYHAPENSAFREYYVLNPNLNPNWFGHLILAGLITLFPILIAEKVFLTGYIILLPLSVRYAVRSIRPDAGFLAFLAFPFIYSYPLHMGFYYFSYSLVVFFFFLGYWLRNRMQLTMGRILVLALLWILLYYTHMVSLVMAAVAVVALALWLARDDILKQSPGNVFRPGPYVKSLSAQLLRPLAALVPTLVLVFLFLQKTGVERTYSRSPATVARWLFRLGSLVSYDSREVWVSTALVGLFLAIALYVLATWKRRSPVAAGVGFLFLFGLYVLICFITPEGISGGSIITPRLVLYVYFALMLWFAAHSFGPVSRRLIPALAVVIAFGMLGLHSVRYRELNDYLEEYLSGMDRIESNTTLLPLCFSRQGHSPEGRELSCRVKPFAHAPGYIAAERRVVEFTNYEANTIIFPVTYRPEVNPYKTMGMLELVPPRLHPRHLRGKADYALVWNIRPDQRERHSTKSILRQLEAEYELIYTSPQRGLMQLYRLRE